MPSSMGLEATISIKPELNWKIVTKGRRSRKSVARSFNGVAKVGNSNSPKRVEDFSGSDSDKIGEMVLGKLTSRRSESVPIKKLRPKLQSPSPQLWCPSLCCQEYASLQASSSPLFEETAKGKLGEVFHGYQAKREYNEEEDFSGIELLAAAAIMEVDDNASKQDHVADDSSMPKDSDPSSSATPSEVCLKINDPENSLIDMTVSGGNDNCSSVLSNSVAASRSPCANSGDTTKPKVNRQHWDLNTLMDAWEEQYDDTIAGNTTNDVNIEKKLKAVSPDREKHLGEPLTNTNFNAAGETPYQATVNDANEKRATTFSNCDAHMDSNDQVTVKENILGNSPIMKMSCSSGLLVSEEKFKSADHGTKMLVEDHSSNLRESDERTSGSNRTLDVTAQDMSTSEISGSPISIQCKVNRDSGKTSELPGTFTQEGQLVLIADQGIQDDGNCFSSSTITDSRGVVAPTAKHENDSLLIESMNVTEDSSKRCSAEAQCDDFTASVRKIGPPNSAVIQNNHTNIVGGDHSGFHQEGYDSPYEDGELRGSFLYSWEEDEIENECVDYESDGRNGDGSDAANYHGDDIVGGVPEGSHSLLVKENPGGKSKGVSASSLEIFVNNEIATKRSYARSGTTVKEQSMKMFIDENDDYMKRSQLSGRRDGFDVQPTQRDEYAPKTPGGKLPSRREGWSSLDAIHGKDDFFIQRCRPRLFGSYPQSERDISPTDKYQGRFRPSTHGEREGERDRVRQFTSWGSRGRYNHNNYNTHYQGPENRTHTRTRSKTGDHPTDGTHQWDFHQDPRLTVNYEPKGLHNRPFMRRSSPVGRDDYFFGPNRRILPTRGTGNYRGRGRYSQRGCGGRNYRDAHDFGPPLPDDDAGGPPPVRTPHYISKRERSFSPPISCRNPHMPLQPPRMISRSRSRTRSPRSKWHPHKEQQQRVWGNRRNNRSRSPDVRPESRVYKMKVMPPFSKPDYGDGGNMSPQRSNFGDDYIRRRSPVRLLRHGGHQRFDAKLDEGFRPLMRPGRFSFGGGRECKLESNYERRRRRDDSGKVRPYGHSEGVGAFQARDLVSNNKNDDDEIPIDVPQALGDVEKDKNAVKV